jgi:putative ABC transport system permease protein
VLDLQFERSQRQHATVTLTEPAAGRALSELRHMPGVLAVEPFRAVPVRLRNGHFSRRVGVTALADDARMFRIMDVRGNLVPLHSDGVFLSTALGEMLGVRAGEDVVMEVLSDERPVVRLPVAGLIDDFSGLSAYMRLDAVHHLLGEQDRISGAHLGVDIARLDDLYRQLKNTPAVAGVALRQATKQSFNDVVGENLMRIRLFNIMFAVIIAFGVVYNSARISLAERSRELATLRVIGFRRAEVSAILLGELAVLTLIAIPLGLGVGYLLSSIVIHAVDSELFRIPLVVTRWTFGFAAVVVLLAALVSGLLVRRRIDHLDLIGVLKTRE